MERKTARQKRLERAKARASSSDQIQFPGFMGFLQRHQRGFFIGGIVVLVASLGVPILFQIIGSGSAPVVESNVTPTQTVQAASTPVTNQIVRSYASEPDFQLEDGVNYEALVTLGTGKIIRLDLLRDAAPGYVNNFVFLARNNFYDGLTFHRVIEGFVAQGGDPTGSGMGGAGYMLTEESNDIALDGEGLVSMAKSAQGVDAAQFFITLGETPWLTGDFTVFARVIEGMDVAHQITVREPGVGQPKPEIILSIVIVEK